jgi:hypothetical protein
VIIVEGKKPPEKAKRNSFLLAVFNWLDVSNVIGYMLTLAAHPIQALRLFFFSL